MSTLRVHTDVYPWGMDIYEARRLAVLELIKSLFSGHQGDFARAADISPSYVSRMLKPEGDAARKRIGEDIARKIEDRLRLAADTLVSPIIENDDGRKPSVAQRMSYQADTVHSLSWEELMTMSGDVESGRAELPSRFWVTLGDDAMGPRAAAGTKMLFVTSEAPRYGDAVLLLGPDGAFHVRQYGQSLSYGFEARPTNPAYEAFHGDMPGVKVVAVMRGIEKPFDQIA